MPFVPSWVRDAGNSAESDLSKVNFEKFVSENKNDTTHRFLFLYDCDMLVASLQDRFSMIGGLVKEFYKNMKFESSHNLKDFDSATMKISEAYAPLFACLNSIFIYLGSSFDLLTKICYELSCIEDIDFSSYPRLKSRKILFGTFRFKDPFNEKTIFDKPDVIKRILSIRNRIVHNGSFDFRQIIYDLKIAKENYSEITIFFPDMNGTNFDGFQNRCNFYSSSNQINLTLPNMLIEVLNLISNTISIANRIYPSKKSTNH